MSTTDTVSETLTPAQQAAQNVAAPETPDEFWKHNVSAVLKSLASFIPFRHEGEYQRIVIALDHAFEDISEVLASKEPIAPTVGQPDPVLQALMAKNADLEAKMDKLLSALSSNPVIQQAIATPEDATPAVPQTEPGTAVIVDENPITPAEPADAPPGWVRNADGTFTQVPTSDTAQA